MTQPVDNQGRPFRRSLLTFVVLVGLFASNFNQTILAVAQPTLMHTFGITAATAQWLSTGYSLIVGILTPVTAWLADNFSSKWLFEAAMGFFLIGTSCAFGAQTFTWLLLGRLIQALGGGLLAGIGTTILFSIYPADQRGTVSALMGLVFGLAPAIGPTFSGWVIDAFNWHLIFGALLPILLLAFILGLWVLRPVVAEHKSRLDWPSVGLSVLGFGGLQFGFAESGNLGWRHWAVLLSIGVGICGIGLFLRRQQRITNPVLQLKVFRVRNYSASVIIMSLSQLAFAGFEFVLPLYLQTVRGFSALTSGMCLVLGALVTAGMSPVTGYALDHYSPKRMIQSGLVIMILGTIPFIFVTTTTPLLTIVLLYAVRSLGFSAVSNPVTALGINSLPRPLIAHGSSGNNLLRFTVSAVGTATLIAVQQSVATRHLPAQQVGHQAAVRLAYLAGYHVAFAAVVLLLVIGLLAGQALNESEAHAV